MFFSLVTIKLGCSVLSGHKKVGCFDKSVQNWLWEAVTGFWQLRQFEPHSQILGREVSIFFLNFSSLYFWKKIVDIKSGNFSLLAFWICKTFLTSFLQFCEWCFYRSSIEDPVTASRNSFWAYFFEHPTFLQPERIKHPSRYFFSFF